MGIGTLKNKGSRNILEELELSTKSFTPAPFTEYEFDENNGGEINFRAPWLPVGYFKNRGESLKTYSEDGRFKPGDAGYLDENGNVRILDRINDLIKSGAEFIPSAFIVNIISEFNSIEMAAVVGKEDLKWGERPWCFIKLKKGHSFDEKDAKNKLKEMANIGKINEWWIPDRFIIIEDMPLTSTGKIDKKVLREIKINKMIFLC